MERINARTLTAATLPEPVDLAVVDVSFISLGLVLAPIAPCCATARAPIVALVKPQFEAGKADAKGGVVRDPASIAAVLRETVARAEAAGLGMRGGASRRRSSGRRATASSSSTSQAGAGVRRPRRADRRRRRAAWEGAG